MAFRKLKVVFGYEVIAIMISYAFVYIDLSLCTYTVFSFNHLHISFNVPTTINKVF